MTRLVYNRSVLGIRQLALIVGVLLVGCVDPPAPSGDFIAIERDFEGFDRWTVFDRGPQPVGPTHPDGSSFIYVNRLPMHGATAFETGTMIVRVTTGGAPEGWEVHAMVKRGGDFNAEGARGWEYFDLQLETVGDVLVPRIVWRGVGPAMGDGYAIPDGGVLFTCNHCHASAIDNDSVLDPELDLRSY